MGRESSHGRKELFNLPPLVLKARALNDGSAFCIGFSRLEVPEQTLGGIPLGLGVHDIVQEDDDNWYLYNTILWYNTYHVPFIYTNIFPIFHA